MPSLKEFCLIRSLRDFHTTHVNTTLKIPNTVAITPKIIWITSSFDNESMDALLFGCIVANERFIFVLIESAKRQKSLLPNHDVEF